MKIGYSKKKYPIERNIINIVPGYVYKKVYDINEIRVLPTLIKKKYLSSSTPINFNIRFSFNDLNLNCVDILHFFEYPIFIMISFKERIL
jgi:hypothetical protein